MLLDWFTVAAQIVNFLVLLILLKIFLYDRVIAAMDAREQTIAERLEQADQQNKDARREADALRNERRELEDQRGNMLAEAREQAQSRRQELMEAARRDVDDQRARWQDALDRGRQAFVRQLQRLAAHQVLNTSRRVVRDLADAPLEEKIVSRFIDKLDDLDADVRRKLSNGGGNGKQTATVASVFPIDTTGRQKITRAVHEKLARDLAVSYEESPELLAGIEITVKGHSIDWNVRDYLGRLEERTLEAIDTQLRQRPQSLEKERPADAKQGRNDAGRQAAEDAAASGEGRRSPSSGASRTPEQSQAKGGSQAAGDSEATGKSRTTGKSKAEGASEHER